ncbi:MAG: universal stress protein [Candidatus Omnitrophica bacterium]|nr:universal stress protein [Candidatus Omnitrophota bacterium]
MKDNLLHIYRNTPFGRETLMQSIYFCRMMKNIYLSVYIPKHTQFLMYFESEVVTIDLDSSYVASPDAAQERVAKMIKEAGQSFRFLEPTDFTANTLPNLPANMTYMTCPRSIVDSTSHIGIGYIGSRVRRIVKNAQFPVLITPPSYKEWKSITVFYGGSKLGRNAVRTAFHMADRTGLPLTIFTQLEPKFSDTYEKNLKEGGLLDRIKQDNIKWRIYDGGNLEENLFNVPFDSIMVVGAAGHGSMKELLFGSKLETIQRTLPNPILVVGPHCTHSDDYIVDAPSTN